MASSNVRGLTSTITSLDQDLSYCPEWMSKTHIFDPDSYDDPVYVELLDNLRDYIGERWEGEQRTPSTLAGMSSEATALIQNMIYCHYIYGKIGKRQIHDVDVWFEASYDGVVMIVRWS